MKRIGLAAVFALFSIMAFAQGQGNGNGPQGGNQNLTPEERAQKMTDHMKTELTLTDAQYKQVYEINLATAKKQAEAKKGNQQERDALRDEHMAALNKVLTPEQQEKAKELKKDRKGKMRKHKGQAEKP